MRLTNSQIFLGLGSNLGDRIQNLKEALDLLAYKIIEESSIYESEPVEYTQQPWFLNAAVQLETADSPVDVLARCLSVEQLLGRLRSIPKGPRTIDIDLLFYGDQIIDQPGLIVPHPAIAHRRFVLLPLSEIAPQLIHPVLKRSISDLLNECSDHSTVRLYLSK